MKFCFEDMAEKLNDVAEEAIANMDDVSDMVGQIMDSRATYKLWMGHDCLAVRSADDRTFQYYGGAEYIEKECRQQLGNYVFYSIDHNAELEPQYMDEEDEDKITGYTRSDRVSEWLDRIKDRNPA